jgi:hypothetical protein
MTKLAALSAKPEIREYAQGAAQDALSKLKVATFLAPNVPVSGTVGRYKKYDEKNRFRIPRTLRANGGRATELGFTAEDQTYNLAAHALDFPVDQMEMEDEGTLIDLLKEGADMVAEVSALSHEKTVVDLALSALGSGTAFAIPDGTDPIKLLDGHILDVLKSAKYGSLMGIRVLMGAGAFLKFKNHPKVTGKFTSNAKGASNPQVSTDMLSSLLITEPEVLTTYSVYDDAAEGIAEDIKFVLNDNIIVFACKGNPTRRDPSFMKTFVKRGAFMVPGSYVRDDGRVEVAKYDWQVDPKVTNAPAAIRLNVTDA